MTRARDFVRFLSATALLALAPTVLSATTYSIATNLDDVVVNGNCTLREAIRAADSNLAVDSCLAGSAADTITLSAGTYPFWGEELVSGGGSLAIQSSALDPFSVSINLANAGRFLRLEGSGSYVLGGLEITHGLTWAAPGDGGAILASGVALEIYNFRFVANVGGRGGAISFESGSPGANLLMHNGSFLSNTSTFGSGGAVRVSVGGSAAADFRDVTFLGNTSTSHLSVEGGALTFWSFTSGNSGSCVRCNFADNSAVSTATTGSIGAEGGAVKALAFGGSRFELVDCRFAGNWAAAPTALARSNVLHAQSSGGSVVLLERLFIDANSGPSDADTWDVSLVGDGGTVEFYDSQLTFGNAGGLKVVSDSAVTLGHLTVADYLTTGARLETVAQGYVLLQNSLVSFNSTDLTTFGTILQTTNFVGGDPGFLNEPAGNYRLGLASPAIGAGTNSVASLRPADLDHGGRIVGMLTDIGCYERGGLYVDGFDLGDAGSWSSHIP